MKTYEDLTAVQRAEVHRDPKVVAAVTARDAARAALAIAFAARDAPLDARNAARAGAIERLFKKGKLK